MADPYDKYKWTTQPSGSDPYSVYLRSEASSETVGKEPTFKLPFYTPGGGQIEIEKNTVRTGLEAIPYAGGIAGGLAGAPLEGIGAIPGAYVGGAGGEGLKEILSRLLRFGGEEMSPTTSGQSLKNILGSGELQGAFETGGQVLSPILKTFSKPLGDWASHSMEQALGATKQNLKVISSEKLVPGMLEKEVTATSRKALLAKATEKAKEFGIQIDAVVDAHTQSGKHLDVGPIVQSLENAKDVYILRDSAGGIKAVIKEPIRQITQIQGVLSKYGSDITPTDLVNLRRFYDKQIAKGKMAFLVDPSKAFTQEAKEAAINSIRHTLNSSMPDLATLNAQFSFWKDMQTVISATVQRTASQTGLMRTGLSYAAGIPAGALGGMAGGQTGAEIGIIAGSALGKLSQTTAWRTISAVNKNRIARFLANGDVARANALAARIAGVMISGEEDEKSKE